MNEVSAESLSYPPATIITGPRHDVEPISQDRGRDLVTANNRGSIVAHDFTSEPDIRESEHGCINPRRRWPFLQRRYLRNGCRAVAGDGLSCRHPFLIVRSVR